MDEGRGVVMVIRLKKKWLLPVVLTAAAAVVAAVLLVLSQGDSSNLVAGGNVLPPMQVDGPVQAMTSDISKVYERYRRPSSEAPYPNPYSFSDFQRSDDPSPLITKAFDKPEEVVLAYFGILNQASNMMGYSGGCGSIGDGIAPYRYAYELLTPERKKEISLQAFTDSFQGIGYITLLKVVPASSAKQGRTSYMVEIETIRGEKESEAGTQGHGGRFAYYYGIMSTKKTDNGYLIDRINLIPEDFLCAPEHGWFYMADAVVQIVYGDNLHLIDHVERVEEDGYMVYVYASGGDIRYRFDFVRITNGYDILLRENIDENGAWKEVSLPTQDWNIKLTG